MSLCWIQPQIIINLVRHNASTTLTSLNLEGYEELNDLVLEFIAGVDGKHQDEDSTESVENIDAKSKDIDEDDKCIQSGGLVQLINLTLPTKSFVTPYGLEILIENLPLLETIKNAGRMGKL